MIAPRTGQFGWPAADPRPVTDGLVVVDKPTGWTSHDVVAWLRRLAGTRRVGHAGTLDPMATGVLVCGIGRATRLLGHLALSGKAYEATIRLGLATTTDDAEGDVVGTWPVNVADGELRTAMLALTGTIQQVPSAVSAVKVGGVRAYARARAGETVALTPRTVTVDRFDLLARRGDLLDVIVDCSSGTYVRALARDLGESLGCGAHLSALRRSRVGPFRLDRAGTLDVLAASFAVIPLADAVAASFPRRDVDSDAARVLAHGGKLSGVGLFGPYGVFGPEGSLLALVEERDGQARPLVVVAPA